MRDEKAEQEIIENAARRYLRCYGGELDDLRQAAWEAIEGARRRWKPERGTPWPVYAWSAVIRALYGYACKTRAPVSGSSHSCKALNQTYGVNFDALHLYEKDRHPSPRSSERILLVAGGKDPEHMTADDEWQKAIALRIAQVLREVRDEPLATSVLIRGRIMRDVAKHYRCNYSRVRRAVRQAREALRADEALQDLWEAAHAPTED